MAFLFSHKEDPLNRTELILQKDSEDDIETTKNDSVTFKGYFGESDDELNKRFDEKTFRSYYYFTGAYVWIPKQHLLTGKGIISKGKYTSRSKTPINQTNMG